MRNRSLLRSFRFFAKHAGYIVGQRAAGALSMAKAEQTGKAAGLVAVWFPDSDADYSFVETWTDKDRAKWDASEHYAEGCKIVRPCDEHGTDCPHAIELNALYGIIDADADYRRVVEAELMGEALAELTNA